MAVYVPGEQVVVGELRTRSLGQWASVRGIMARTEQAAPAGPGQALRLRRRPGPKLVSHGAGRLVHLKPELRGKVPEDSEPPPAAPAGLTCVLASAAGRRVARQDHHPATLGLSL